MPLKDLLADGRIRAHTTSAAEVAHLLAVIDRDLADAGLAQLSADRRFATAYNAALQLATTALHAAGYRAAGAGHHWATLHVLPDVMGAAVRARADYLDTCRSKRNVTDYDRAGEISLREVEEIVNEVTAFRADLVAWLRSKHPALLPAGTP
jgi:hypothetical protein